MKKNIFMPVMVTVCCALAGCSTEYSAVYQSVDAESKWDESARITLHGAKQEPLPYKVKDNRLYLLIQSSRVDWGLYTTVEYPSWDRVQMNGFIEKHRDIRSLVPVDWNNWLPAGYGDECKSKKA